MYNICVLLPVAVWIQGIYLYRWYFTLSYLYFTYVNNLNSPTTSVLLPLCQIAAQDKNQQVHRKTSHNGCIDDFCKTLRESLSCWLLSWAALRQQKPCSCSRMCPAEWKPKPASCISDAPLPCTSTQGEVGDIHGRDFCKAVCRPQPHGCSVDADASQWGSEWETLVYRQTHKWQQDEIN